jgi:hypothetical protein
MRFRELGSDHSFHMYNYNTQSLVKSTVFVWSFNGMELILVLGIDQVADLFIQLGANVIVHFARLEIGIL